MCADAEDDLLLQEEKKKNLWNGAMIPHDKWIEGSGLSLTQAFPTKMLQILRMKNFQCGPHAFLTAKSIVTEQKTGWSQAKTLQNE